ncbi:tetratricopeptide repeat protein [Brachyspira murdochii]|uniref:TPR repeat-containing protein n=1 Tax=Brachyspira murdochii (strain ATCC 51284 / DSM 12563 / 56-150) TaxID=526224 RepID=D5U962_BRAM5|nr:CDC27 family protein [Brachyspira murdochii]ADG71235.1 TPR repeat-containing protein [Brachyspira murdochii DSM 12563]
MKNIDKYFQDIDNYIQSSNYEDAFSLCNNILDNIDINNTEAIFKAGYCAYKLERYDIAMINFLKALSLDKSNINKAMYKYYMGRCYDIFNSLEDSLECFKGAYKLDKSNHYYALWLGITYAKIGANDYNYNLSLLYLYKAFGIEDSLLYRYAGYCHMQLKSYDKAIEFLEKSILLKDDDYLSRYYLGYSYFSVQIYDKALENLSESLKLKDDEFNSWLSIGILYRIIDEEALSEECLEKARNIALNYSDNIDYQLECFIKLTEAEENEYLNYLYLGICYAKLESYKNALQYLLQSIEINEKYCSENNYLAYYWIGYINYIDSEYEEAVKYLERSIKLNDDEENYLILFWLGDSYFRLSNYKKALFNLQKSLDLKEDEIETYKLIAKTYLELGDKDKYNEYITQYKILSRKDKHHNNRKNNSDNQLKKMQEDYNNHFKSFYYSSESRTNDLVLKQKIFNRTAEMKLIQNDEDITFYDNYYHTVKTDINNFLKYLFEDIEKSDLYHLYSSSIEKKHYIDFDNFNIDNFLYYKDIVGKAVRLDFNKDKEVVQYLKIIDNYDTIIMAIDNIESLFNYTSLSVLQFMEYYYQRYDIELYFILMNLILKYL